jgi:glycosyltransferase involved in cell wall biosynthesis
MITKSLSGTGDMNQYEGLCVGTRDALGHEHRGAAVVHHYDVLIVTDFRHNGGTTVSIAQEVEVQARMGLRTGLIQIQAPHLPPGPWSERVRAAVAAGFAEVVSARERVRARLLVLRQPRAFGHPGWSLAARADQVLFVANQVPRDGARRKPYYSVSDVQRRLGEELGSAPRWAPIGPVVRGALVAEGAAAPELTATDWHNIINVSAWTPTRLRQFRKPVVIGRHSRDDAKKWPEHASDVLAAYPDSTVPTVRVLGGVSAMRVATGLEVSRWRTYGFGSVSPEEFLASLDAYVYFHHSGLREAFGRSVLEALASGLPVITHPYLATLFGDACLYGEPRDTPRLLGELVSNPANAMNHGGVQFVRERFDWEVHRNRLAAHLGTPMPPIRRERTTAKRVLWVALSDETSAAGQPWSALARRTAPRHEPLVLSQSLAEWAAFRSDGIWTDYVPPPARSGLETEDWARYARARVAAAIRVLRPRAVVLVGDVVVPDLLDVFRAFPEVRRVHARFAEKHAAHGLRERAPFSAREAEKGHFDLEFDVGDAAVAGPDSVGPEIDRLLALGSADPRRASDAQPPCLAELETPASALDRAGARAGTLPTLWRAIRRKVSEWPIKRLLRRRARTPAACVFPNVLVAPGNDAPDVRKPADLERWLQGAGPRATVLVSTESVSLFTGVNLPFELLMDPVQGELGQRLELSTYGCARADAFVAAHGAQTIIVWGSSALRPPLDSFLMRE